MSVDRDDRNDVHIDDGLQSGGTRGSSNQGGPERSVQQGEEPAKNAAVKVNRGHDDEGSRSSLGTVDADPAALEEDGGRAPGRVTGAPRGPLPPGTTRADYVGGDEPHKTDMGETAPGASGRRNEVL
jgi:hypothetical protein